MLRGGGAWCFSSSCGFDNLKWVGSGARGRPSSNRHLRRFMLRCVLLVLLGDELQLGGTTVQMLRFCYEACELVLDRYTRGGGKGRTWMMLQRDLRRVRGQHSVMERSGQYGRDSCAWGASRCR
ncbi:hypothetical protein FIBSPDRAFT_392621 [Athelia psychrophila]|uniref:Uncharacterized protein n=1 Tax=Athelia psychrophila TaxID=1759441 RepID=A0A167V3F9_9AGAM|nr:hypothetical protein FIBSPDRAFT_392621 [Fibularhizoctonia sp. CBS 109695]